MCISQNLGMSEDGKLSKIRSPMLLFIAIMIMQYDVLCLIYNSSNNNLLLINAKPSNFANKIYFREKKFGFLTLLNALSHVA